jgi:hypothetical protein
MSILEKLIEKKDLVAYIKWRKEDLWKQWEISMVNSPDEYKEQVNQKFRGRISELNILLSIVNNNALKSKSKMHWNAVNDAMAGEPERECI